MELTYPADSAEAGLRFFSAWLGAHYARSVTVESFTSETETLTAVLRVGRKWTLRVALANTLAPEADLPFDAARAVVEQRLDTMGHEVALWAPRGGDLPVSEPGLSELMMAMEAANVLPDGRREVRRPVRLNLRRAGTTGSVVTVLGGLSAHWAQFTNRVPGTFQLNSFALKRLPASAEERTALADRIVMAAQQPLADENQTIVADDAWTATALPGGRACVFGSPKGEDDEQSATLRRNLRRILKGLDKGSGESDASALVILAAATYAEDERVTWALRGMDPRFYLGYDLVVVMVDGLVRPLVVPGRSALPWDA